VAYRALGPAPLPTIDADAIEATTTAAVALTDDYRRRDALSVESVILDLEARILDLEARVAALESAP